MVSRESRDDLRDTFLMQVFYFSKIKIIYCIFRKSNVSYRQG